MSKIATDAHGVYLVPMGVPDHSKCRHFNGTVNKRCAAGVEYATVNIHHDAVRYRHVRPNGRVDAHAYSMSGSIPCSAKWNFGGATCEHYSPPTEAEIAAKQAERERAHDLMIKGLSDCCEATINESQVIREGKHKGHGPRRCSKCGRCMFVV